MQMQVVPGEPNAETIWCSGGFEQRLGAVRAAGPRTGRKHQLRAQMNAQGLPLAGDRVYPVLQPHEAEPGLLRRSACWRASWNFCDPLTGKLRRLAQLAHSGSPASTQCHDHRRPRSTPGPPPTAANAAGGGAGQRAQSWTALMLSSAS